MDASQLDQLRRELKNLIASNQIDNAIDRLKSIVPSSSIRYNLLIKFQQEHTSISESKWKAIYSPTELGLKRSKLVDNLLEFVDILEESDFHQPGQISRKRHRTGSVLYAIPSQMEIGKEQKCVIRLAFDEDMLREYFAPDNDTRIESLRRIEEQMEVELVDPNEEDVFAIRTINSKRQIVEQDDYTEWLYYVKPNREGVFELYLKVTVIIADKGKKEIVLHEKVEVTTHPAEELEVVSTYKDTGLLFTLAIPGAAGPVGQEAPADASPSGSASSSKGIWSSMSAKVGAAIGGTALVGGLLMYGPFGSKGEQDQGMNAGVNYVKQVIHEPLPEISNFSEVFVLDPIRDTTFQTQSGTQVSIPAYSMVDREGIRVSEKVEIRIREIRTAQEIIASGIPMRYYESDGTESWMQTAGMFEVHGFMGEEKVEIAEGKTVTINFTTETEGSVDFWFFNEESGNWENQEKATTAVDNPNLVTVEEEIPVVKPPQAPIQPVIGDPKKIVPASEIDYRNFPELKEFRNLEWEYVGPPESNPRNNPALRKPWDRLEIIKGRSNGYKLTYIRADEKIEVPVRPCFRSANDMQAFKRSMVKYERKQQEYETYLKRKEEQQAFQARQYSFVRQVGIRQFGIYNWDYLIKTENALPLTAKFDFEGQLPEHLEKDIIVYLITGEGRTVISFPPSSWSRFSFIPNLDNSLVAVLPGGRVALFSQEEFKTQKESLQQARNKNYEFRMKVLSESVQNIKDLEQIIG